MSTAQQRLDEVRVAIQDILKKGQSVRKGDRQVDRAQLASLRILEQQYAAAAAQEAAANNRRSRQVRLYSAGKGV
ncbi:preprotein translocase subunit SecA [Pseudomonas aeruginosa YL84]|uniref:hypothetical protein n=2 Tax=Pseudomonas aeruginosa TaxID=287 RepID=UPI0003E77365|nr:hypothetical protein [Pseudomonas aeruginosa]AHH52636.1 preprotein translocase subunit SecA [Pseudomonas aeruginosa YL84]HBN8336069.1 hypothetical protein [Pseudomonas aeruginosa]HCF4326898.1 hypothetical protein [Pseudomonas aeruginosa]